MKLMKMDLRKITDLEIKIRKEDDGKRTITHLQGSPDGINHYFVVSNRDKARKGPKYSLLHGRKSINKKEGEDHERINSISEENPIKNLRQPHPGETGAPHMAGMCQGPI